MAEDCGGASVDNSTDDSEELATVTTRVMRSLLVKFVGCERALRLVDAKCMRGVVGPLPAPSRARLTLSPQALLPLPSNAARNSECVTH